MIKEIQFISKKFLSRFSHLYTVPNNDIQEFKIILNKNNEMSKEEKITKMKDICEALNDVYTLIIFDNKVLLTIKSENDKLLYYLRLLFNELSDSVVRI